MTSSIKCWCLFAFLRIFLTLLPQRGYIHPDEFFQSVEITAGDVFEVDVVRTWEFNSSFPIRSIVPVYLMSGPAFLLLRCLESIGLTKVINSYFVLVLPRLFMATLSFLLDFAVCRIASVNGLNGIVGMLILSSSYVTVVYYTRTFSNSFEGILFAVLLLETLPQVFKIQKQKHDILMSRVHSNTWGISSTRIGIVITLGLFNRPTFAAYAFIPYVCWLFGGNSGRTLGYFSYSEIVLQKAVGSITSGLLFAILFVVCDSIYFGRLSPTAAEIASTVQNLGVSEFLLKNLTVTPLNFLVYNTQSSNLADHGLHPKYTHLVANIQILFSFLGISAIRNLFTLFLTFIRKRKSPSDSIIPVLLLSYAVPLLFLSIFPHQEPRFLVPLLTPLALLSSVDVVWSKRWARVFWIVFNILGCVFFGFFHQGGVVPAVRQLQSSVNESNHFQMVRVIFWRTYMPPQHLLLQRLQLNKTYEIHDLAGTSHEKLFELLNVSQKLQGSAKTLLLSPGAVYHQLMCSQGPFHFEVVDQFWPHFSGEDLPHIDDLFCSGDRKKTCQSDVNCSAQTFAHRLYNTFSLYCYHVWPKR